MQEQMNSMNHSGDFQDVESNKSGSLSNVFSQLEMVPSSRSLLSRDKRLPLDTWNQSGVQENVFGNQFSTFDSLRDFLKEFHLTTCKDIEKQCLTNRRGKTSLTSEDGQNYGTIPMPIFATRPLTTSSKNPVDIPQNYVVEEQRQQISELQFDKFLIPNHFGVENTIQNSSDYLF